MFSRFFRWLKSERKAEAEDSRVTNRPAQDSHREGFKFSIPEVTYADSVEVSVPPSNENVAPGSIYIVEHNEKKKWVIFQCPCKCGDVITLPLLKVHHPHWNVSRTPAERSTLFPSVWRDVGCLSHFILKDGRVYWCDNTGTPPTRWGLSYLEHGESWDDV